jgi:hypothetical protein
MQCGIEGKPCGHGYGPAANQDSLLQGGTRERGGGVRGGLKKGMFVFFAKNHS